MDKLTISILEAAEALGVGRTAAYEAARTGEIPTIRIGKRLLVPIVALERRLIEACGLGTDLTPAEPVTEREATEAREYKRAEEVEKRARESDARRRRRRGSVQRAARSAE